MKTQMRDMWKVQELMDICLDQRDKKLHQLRSQSQADGAQLAACQEIGLVASMFIFKLLFPYVSSSISFYVPFTNLFSIILFLIC